MARRILRSIERRSEPDRTAGASARRIAAALAVVSSGLGLALLGCATARVSPRAVTIGVSFEWTLENMCSQRSPEIRVAELPPQTAELQVVLQDLDAPTYNHGGGSVRHDGSGVIAAGALRHYKGPCPPGLAHRYRFTVRAVDAAGVVVGMGAAERSCCEGL